MKTKRSAQFSLALLLGFCGGFAGNLFFSSEAEAQPSPAAQAIQNRIENGGLPGAAAPAAQTPAPRKRRHKSEIEQEKKELQAAAQAAAGAAPAAVPAGAEGGAAADGTAAVPVKKEREPVEIITEPFMVYDHKAKASAGAVLDPKSRENEEEKDASVTAVAADLDGVNALSASKDATIQLWYTYDFYYEEFYDYFGGFDINLQFDETGAPIVPQAGAGKANQGKNGTQTGTAQGKETAGFRGTQSAQRMGGTNTAQERRNANANQARQSEKEILTSRGRDAQGNPIQTAGAGYSDESYQYTFYGMRRGNLQAASAAVSDNTADSQDGKTGKKSSRTGNVAAADQTAGKKTKKEKKFNLPTTLGKRRALYERLDSMGNRKGKGFCDMLVSPYDQFMYTSDYNGSVRRWNLYTKKCQIFPYTREKAVNNTMWAVAVYPAFDYGFPCDWVAGANNNGRIYIWSGLTRKLLAEMKVATSEDPKKQALLDIDFAPDGSVVTAGIDGTARVIDLFALQTVSLLKGHKGPVFSAVFDSTGQYVLTASKDKSVCLWDSSTGEIAASFIGHTGAVRKAVFLNDRFILTCSDDKTARVWELPDEVSLSPAAGLLNAGQTAPAFDANGNPIPQTAPAPDADGSPITAAADGTAVSETAASAAAEGWATSEKTIGEEIDEIADDDDDEADESGDKEKTAAVDTEKVKTIQEIEAEVPEQSISKAPRGFEVLRFEGTSPVLSITNNEYYIITGCKDGKVRVWDLSPYLAKLGLVAPDNKKTKDQKADPNAAGAVPPGIPPAGAPGALPPAAVPAADPNAPAAQPGTPAVTPPGAGAGAPGMS